MPMTTPIIRASQYSLARTPKDVMTASVARSATWRPATSAALRHGAPSRPPIRRDPATAAHWRSRSPRTPRRRGRALASGRTSASVPRSRSSAATASAANVTSRSLRITAASSRRGPPSNASPSACLREAERPPSAERERGRMLPEVRRRREDRGQQPDEPATRATRRQPDAHRDSRRAAYAASTTLSTGRSTAPRAPPSCQRVHPRRRAERSSRSTQCAPCGVVNRIAVVQPLGVDRRRPSSRCLAPSGPRRPSSSRSRAGRLRPRTRPPAGRRARRPRGPRTR